MRLAVASLIVTVCAAPLARAQTAPAAATPPAASAPAPSAIPAQGAPPAAQPPAPATPPAPPPPPTDPTAIAIIDTLQSICIPAVEGGNLDRLARSNGYRKSSDNYVLKGRGFQLTLYPSGSNPTQCHIDVVSPVYPEAPAAAIVVALHNWAAVERGWTLYRNDKSVDSGQQLTTRSWEHDDPGKHEAMFITTYRRPDGAPMKGSADTSTLVYSETPAS
ncbi:MAG TPA: hypothetical protein VGN38_08050 [Caulobacteraceae bacterium]|nr:hypothetical protein [Caulobacteraceae bacterium]